MSTFTEEDAMNDGKVREETEPEMISVAKKESPRIFQHFENVCESMDQAPRTVLGNMLIRALNNEEFAQHVLSVDIDIAALNSEEITLRDIELVDDIADRFDLKPDGRKHPVERIIDSRLEAVGGSPFDAVREVGEDALSKRSEVSELKAEVSDLQRKLDKALEDSDSGNQRTADSVESGGSRSTTSESDKSVDDIFEGMEDDEEEDEPEGVSEPSEDVDFDSDMDEYSGDTESFTIAEDEESEEGNTVGEEDVVTEGDDSDDSDEEEVEDMEITTNDDVDISDEDEEVEE